MTAGELQQASRAEQESLALSDFVSKLFPDDEDGDDDDDQDGYYDYWVSLCFIGLLVVALWLRSLLCCRFGSAELFSGFGVFVQDTAHVQLRVWFGVPCLQGFRQWQQSHETAQSQQQLFSTQTLVATTMVLRLSNLGPPRQKGK